MANQEQVERLRGSTQEWNQWRQQWPDLHPELDGANFDRANLYSANLSNANLKGASLWSADLYTADLSEADLTEADLSNANLHRTNLNRANLSRVNLIEANLSEANFDRANLSGACLNGADLSRSNLSGANFTNVQFFYTIFAGVDLSHVEGLETAIHDGPSTVDINSVVFPPDKNARLHFLRGVGFSDTIIDYLSSLLAIPIQYHSLFLSYSHRDEDFTKQIYADLQNQGVRCWFAPHDLRPGTPIVRGIEEAIHLQEKLLLILSHHAVDSPWVQQEVEAALYKEVTTGQEILFPIRLDNTVLESETLWAKRLRQRHIGDFTGWQNKSTYQQAFTALLRHLKVA